MDAIAEKLGLEPTYQDSSFDTIFRDVGSGQFDMVAAAATITPAREKKVDFSDPYYERDAGAGGPGGLRHRIVDDLGGKIVGAQDGTTGEDYAERRDRRVRGPRLPARAPTRSPR